MKWSEKQGLILRQPESQSGALASLRYATLIGEKDTIIQSPFLQLKKDN